MTKKLKQVHSEQLSEQPGKESSMSQKPQSNPKQYKAAGKLLRKAAIITGGDSGIGRAVAIAFAKEGADVAVAYYDEEVDAQETKKLVEAEGVRCLLLAGDIGDEKVCKKHIEKTVKEFGRLDIVVNNAAEQHVEQDFTKITSQQLERVFRTNIFGIFYLTQAALPHMNKGGSIINTTSVVAYQGHPLLIDYATTKGAIVAFTRSLSTSLAAKDIRVNGVAPGPIWTPLIPATFPKEKVAKFGKDVPLGRPGQPEELAPAFVFLASEDASYITGQVIHVNGGTIVNG